MRSPSRPPRTTRRRRPPTPRPAGLLGSFSVNLPKALDNGGTLAEFDGDVNNASSLTVQATSTNTATASANIFSLGGIAAGAGASFGRGDRLVRDHGGQRRQHRRRSSSPLGSIQVFSTSTNHADATANGFTGSLGVSIAVMNPTAFVAGATTADFDGDVTSCCCSSSRSRRQRSPSGRARRTARPHTRRSTRSRSSAAAPAATPTRRSPRPRTTRRSIGPDANVTVSGAVTVDAGQSSANTANATIDATAFGTVSGAVIASEAHINGAVLAELDGSVNAGGSLTVQANGTNNSTSTTNSFGLGGISFSGAALARHDRQPGRRHREGRIVGQLVQNDVSVTATSTNTANATSDAATGGLLGAVSVNKPTAKVDGATLAEFDGDVTNGTAVAISSTSNNTATAEASVISIGLGFAGAGASSDATIGSDATTNAIVGSTSSSTRPALTSSSRRPRPTARLRRATAEPAGSASPSWS